MTFAVPSSVRIADDCGIHVCIYHWHISRLGPLSTPPLLLLVTWVGD
jgi:hypothetical protein